MKRLQKKNSKLGMFIQPKVGEEGNYNFFLIAGDFTRIYSTKEEVKAGIMMTMVNHGFGARDFSTYGLIKKSKGYIFGNEVIDITNNLVN